MINQRVIIRYLLLLFIGLLFLGFVESSKRCDPSDKQEKFDWNDKENIMFDEGRYPGEWYIIDCSLPDNMADVSLWRQKNDEKKEIVPDQHKVKKSNQVFNITNLTSEDSGTYFCKACNRADKERGFLSIETDGLAYQTPTILNKTQSNVSYGSEVVMYCKVTGWYVLNWRSNSKNGDLIVPQRRHVINKKMYVENLGKWENGMYITKRRLTIKRFNLDDAGVYTCIAERPGLRWKAKDEVSLEVVKDGISLLKPRISKTPTFETAGDNIKMVCESDGSVLMQWIKNGRQLPCHGGSFQGPMAIFKVTKKTLRIRNLSKQDEGIYECRVYVKKRRQWSIAETINITMKVKPTIKKDNPNEVTSFKEGRKIKCELSTKAVPRATINWKRCVCDGNCSECKESAEKWFNVQDTGSTTRTNSEMSSTLTIHKLTSDRVIYRSRAENGAGSDEREWIVVKDLMSQTKDVCLNGGQPLAGSRHQKCSCPFGYKGYNCSEIVTPCEGKPCRNSGKCTDKNDGTFTCECQGNYRGILCHKRVTPCQGKPCRNSGKCKDKNDGTFTCECQGNYRGILCQKRGSVNAVEKLR